MATAKSNGRKWVKVQRRRWWKPDDDSSPLIVRLLERNDAAPGARVQRGHYIGEVLEEACDTRGDIPPGTQVRIGENVVLADVLPKLVGQVVRITPAGLDGRVKLYDVEVGE